MNYDLADALNDLSGHSGLLDSVMRFAATYLIYGCFAILAMLVVRAARAREWSRIAQVGSTLVLAFVFGLLASQLYAEPRPFTSHGDIRQLIPHAAGQSFPSDHATAAFAIGFAVLVFLSGLWGRALLTAAVVIGLARVYTGVHYPGDILGSLVVALLAVAVVEVASRRLMPASRTA